MDPVGDIFKEYFEQARSNAVRNAFALGEEYIKDGMTAPQIREMLYASGFDGDIVKESVRRLFPEGKR